MTPLREFGILLGLWVLASVPAGEPKWFHTYGGPFKVNVKRFEVCPNEKQGSVDLQYRIYRGYHQPTRYDLNVSLPSTIDDSLTFKANVAVWSNSGGWKENAHVFSVKNACTESFRHFKHMFNFWMNIIMGEVLSCPVLPGLYFVRNLTVPEDLMYSPLIQNFVYGKWRAESQLAKDNGDVVYCSRTYLDTVPK